MTRHNAGFMAVDIYIGRLGLGAMSRKHGSWFLKTSVKGVETGFLKPGSFMNLSGGPVSAVMDDLGVTPADLLVMHDDIDIKQGLVRHKFGGGHGGHNGLRSIIESIGAADFHRVRLGVGRPPEGESASDYVLSVFDAQEEEDFLKGLEVAYGFLEGEFLLTVDQGADTD